MHASTSAAWRHLLVFPNEKTRRLEGRAQKGSQSMAFAPAGPMRQAAAEALDISQSTDTCARSDAAARSISRASGQERGSHAALSVHGTNEACVRHAWAVQKANPRTRCPIQFPHCPGSRISCQAICYRL